MIDLCVDQNKIEAVIHWKFTERVRKQTLMFLNWETAMLNYTDKPLQNVCHYRIHATSPAVTAYLTFLDIFFSTLDSINHTEQHFDWECFLDGICTCFQWKQLYNVTGIWMQHFSCKLTIVQFISILQLHLPYSRVYYNQTLTRRKIDLKEQDWVNIN